MGNIQYNVPVIVNIFTLSKHDPLVEIVPPAEDDVKGRHESTTHQKTFLH